MKTTWKNHEQWSNILNDLKEFFANELGKNCINFENFWKEHEYLPSLKSLDQWTGLFKALNYSTSEERVDKEIKQNTSTRNGNILFTDASSTIENALINSGVASQKRYWEISEPLSSKLDLSTEQ